MDTQLILSCVGLGLILSIATGLRAFLVPFVLACAQGLQWIDLGSSMAWIGTPLAIGTFGAAIIIETLADKIPAVDHAFDVVHTIAKPLAGSLAAMALIHGQDPVVHAVAGLATGGVVAGGTHLLKAGVRVGSTMSTFGLGNTAISLIEDVLALSLAAAATYGLSYIPMS